MATMVRINAAIRDHVVWALLDKKYVEQNLEVQRLKEESSEADKAAAKLAYEAAYTPTQRMVLEKSPQGYFPEVRSVNIRVADPNNADNYEDRRIEFGEEKRVFFRNSNYKGMFAAVIDRNHPYIVQLEKARELQRQYNIKVSELRDKKAADARRIETIVSSVTTVNRLQEIWPEVVEYLPENVSGPGGGLPAHMIADINKEFGLSKEDEAA